MYVNSFSKSKEASIPLSLFTYSEDISLSIILDPISAVLNESTAEIISENNGQQVICIFVQITFKYYLRNDLNAEIHVLSQFSISILKIIKESIGLRGRHSQINCANCKGLFFINLFYHIILRPV